jgi:hypothetical protein
MVMSAEDRVWWRIVTHHHPTKPDSIALTFMKIFLTFLAFVFLASAQAAPIQVTLQMPAGLQVGKNQIVAQVQAAKLVIQICKVKSNSPA